MPAAYTGTVDRHAAEDGCAELYTASEQLFFRGAHLAHVVAFEEFRRESRRQRVIEGARRYRRPLAPMVPTF